ncbi:MAG: ArsR family transcriptional regulator [Gammaproteobacteria bacterium HGW-Gammaproteobacteria-3]|nr:MAG: ArsR family transcriptional regulator [Gammaproteobacteria bacterium HGW-Gammaproteobacteria-3]
MPEECMKLPMADVLPAPAMPNRHRILRQLLENKEGWSINKLALYLNVSRTAAQNHCQTLEKEGLIKKNSRLKTLGRPSVTYVLTDKGIAYFPKKYALFSVIVLRDLKNEMGSEGFIGYMQKLGKRVADQYRAYFTGLNEEERVKNLLTLMQELGFYPRLLQNTEIQAMEISVHNCIYHEIAQEIEEVCAFDQTLMAELANKEVELRSCMSKGDEVCCFRMHTEKR